MVVSFDSLSDESKIWIFQSNQVLRSAQIKILDESIKVFLDQWTSHQSTLYTAYTIRYNLFLIIGVDRSQNVSGCSIDALMREIQRLEREYHLVLLNRMNVAFVSKGKLKIADLTRFREFIDQGIVTKKTTVFNNMIIHKKNLQSNWQVPLENSWHKRYL